MNDFSMLIFGRSSWGNVSENLISQIAFVSEKTSRISSNGENGSNESCGRMMSTLQRISHTAAFNEPVRYRQRRGLLPVPNRG